ncbi:MAG: tetratricopeptide repeat protein [Steroidobacteraceae bacterium]
MTHYSVIGRLFCLLGLLVSNLLATPLWAASKSPSPLMSVPKPVLDLYYGDSLFYFYQDDYFQSLVHLDAAITQRRVANHQTEAELLKGALYLSLGQHIEAGRIFQALLNDNVDLDVRNHAWFYLAKIWYQRGYWSESESALNSIQGGLVVTQEAERQLLLAQVLMKQDRYQQAASVLQSLEGKETNANWLAYAHFNLGVALIRQEKTEEGAAFLNQVGSLTSDNEELQALRDKANLALGFARIKQGRAAEAEQVLQRIRLNGPLSNKALLGLGWAQSSEGKFNEALVPWQELKQRDLLDAAVQEAYLAIPYAYAQLGANDQATQSYRFALDSFKQETARLDESITSIRDGALLKTVLDNDKSDQSGWYWQLRNLPDAPETRYLYDLLASNTFQEALKNYRDLQVMQKNLLGWTQSMEAFQDMVDTRNIAFEQRTATMQQALDSVDIDALEAKVLEFDTRVSEIARDEDVVSLATSKEQDNWRRVMRLEHALSNNDGSDVGVAAMQDKTRLLRGALYWNMSSNYKARLWNEQKQVRELGLVTKEVRRRHTLVERAREQVPQRTQQFAARVAELAPRLQIMLDRCRASDAAQQTYLAKVAIEQLQQQKQRLAQYALQAQFALASIYDRAATSGTGVNKATTVPAKTEGAGQ